MTCRLSGVSFADLLDADPRPSCVISLEPLPTTSDCSSFPVVYTNPAFANDPSLVSIIHASPASHQSLWDWITAGHASSALLASLNNNNTATISHSPLCYLAHHWTRTVQMGKWVLVAVTDQDQPFPKLQQPPLPEIHLSSTPHQSTGLPLNGSSSACSTPEEPFLKSPNLPIHKRGTSLGFMHSMLDTNTLTRRRQERWNRLLLNLADSLAFLDSLSSYTSTIMAQLAAFDCVDDVPFALLYSIHYHYHQPPSWAAVCRLEGNIGIPTGHPITTTDTFSLPDNHDGLAPIFQRALDAPGPLVFDHRDPHLPTTTTTLFDGLHSRVSRDPCRAAIVCPIRPHRRARPMAFLVLGINPNCPYDSEYQKSIILLTRILAMTLASTVLLRLEDEQTSAELPIIINTPGTAMGGGHAASASPATPRPPSPPPEECPAAEKVERVADFIPVGMGFSDSSGRVTFANEAWHRITGMANTTEPILSCVVDDDKSAVAQAYESLKTESSVDFEFRIHPSRAASPLPRLATTSPIFDQADLDLNTSLQTSQVPRRVVASAKAERAPDGAITRILTCLTDVTLHSKHVTHEAVHRSRQAETLQRMAEYSTVALFDMDLEGRLLGANDVFFDMCGLDRVDVNQCMVEPWAQSFVAEDYPLLCVAINRLATEDKMQQCEVRLKTTWVADDDIAAAGQTMSGPRWVLITFIPVTSADGDIKSFTGCMTDISLQKWQFVAEQQRKEEAIESKRQHEHLIDMTSHEMRNPLSAIIHCSDAVIASLTWVRELLSAANVPLPSPSPTTPSPFTLTRSLAVGGEAGVDHAPPLILEEEMKRILAEGISNAETIMACAQHQKRIVDDILTMSKLDSDLIAITRVTINPIHVVHDALKMFEVEARRVDVDLTMHIDAGFARHLPALNFLDFDPSRLTQVLINLLTNAIKFTKSGSTRKVSVVMSASHTRPTEAGGARFIPPSVDLDAAANGDGPDDTIATTCPPCHGCRRPVYLIIEVRDTGHGLTEDEMKPLFQRFVQASSRTHIHYGGSGLGLFISRRLTEMQRGAIGVTSLPGVGSTFAFYIEAYEPSDEALREARTAAAAAAADQVTPPPVSTPTTAAVDRQFAPSLSLSLLPSFISAGRLDNPSGSTATSTARTLSRTPPSRSLPSPTARSLKSPAADLAASSFPLIKGVLVVEDNPINQQITRRGLVDRGFTVDVANHGLECLEKLVQSDHLVLSPGRCASVATLPAPPLPSDLHHPDHHLDSVSTSRASDTWPNREPFPAVSLILMDIEMPILDGLACTKQIRRLERDGHLTSGHIPIIAVSANARTEQILQAKMAGCDEVLIKPYRMTELIDKMRTVMAAAAQVSYSAPSDGPEPPDLASDRDLIAPPPSQPALVSALSHM